LPMFDFDTGTTSPDCTGVSRRSFLRVGALSALGLALPQFLRMKAAAGETAARKDIRCILLWMQGGPSHIDSVDPKPDAPAEIRGEFKTIPTTLSGVRVAEHLPRLAKLTNDYSIIRGHDPKNGSHGVADHLMMSGRPFNPALPFPCFGSVVAKERGYVNGMLPFVQMGRNIDRRFNGGIAGFLGDQYNPFEVNEDPNAPVFRVRDLSLASKADRDRLERRYNMLTDLEAYQRSIESQADVVQARDTFYEKAHSLITSPIAKKAFDISAEPSKLRESYGRNQF